MTTQTTTFSPLAESIFAFEMALEAVCKLGNITFSVNPTQVYPDDAGEFEIIFSEVSSRNIVYIETALDMVKNNKRLSDRVRDIWVNQQDRRDSRYNVFTYWIQG